MTYKLHVKKDLVWLTVWEDTVHPREGVASGMRGRERRGRQTGLLNSLPPFCSVCNPSPRKGSPTFRVGSCPLVLSGVPAQTAQDAAREDERLQHTH